MLFKTHKKIQKPTKKSDGPKYLMRLFDKSRRSNDVSEVSECVGTLVNALFGNPSACNGIFNPKNACRCTRLISPDDITRPNNETLSKIRASLKNVTFFNVQSSRETGYLDCRRPCAICCRPWMSPLHRSVYGISQPHSKYRLFSLIFGHFQSSIVVVSWSIPVDLIFRLRKSILLYTFPPFDVAIDFVAIDDFIHVDGCPFNDADDDDRLLWIGVWGMEWFLLSTIWLIALHELSVLWFLVGGPLFSIDSLFTVMDLSICCASNPSDWTTAPFCVNANGDRVSISWSYAAVVRLSINGSFIFVESMWRMTSNTLSRCKLLQNKKKTIRKNTFS